MKLAVLLVDCVRTGSSEHRVGTTYGQNFKFCKYIFFYTNNLTYCTFKCNFEVLYFSVFEILLLYTSTLYLVDNFSNLGVVSVEGCSFCKR